MKAYILSSGVTISPFQDPVTDCYIGNRKLKDNQDKVLKKAGLEIQRIDSPEEIKDSKFFLCYDDVFFTSRVMDTFVKVARQKKHSLQLGLPADSLFVKRTNSLQELDQASTSDGEKLTLYRLYFISCDSPPNNSETLSQRLKEAKPQRARFREKTWKEPAPKHISGFSHYQHPVTSSVIIHIGHWVHVLWANQFSIQIRWVETILSHKLWVFFKVLASVLHAIFTGRWSKAGFKWSLFSYFNRKGKNVQIHPTARVEFCQLGDNVTIGAYALVRGCLVGDNVTIEDRANVYFSVVGDDCFISKNSTMVFCAGYPDSDLCVNGIQACLFGSRCAMTSRVWVIDIRAAGVCRVLHKGKLQLVNTEVLGCCFGHGVFAGMDITFGQGREIPNGTVLIRPPGEILCRIPDDLPPKTPAWVKNGTAVTKE